MHRIVGLDVSATELRMVALQSGFRGFELQEARRAALATEGLPADRLKAALAELGIGGEDTIAIALPASKVSSHNFTLPFTDQKRIEQVLPAEIEGAIPFDLADVAWSFAVLGQDAGKSQVLVAVVKREILREHLQLWRDAGADPRLITFAPLALAALAERRLIDDALGQEDVVLAPEGEGGEPASVPAATGPVVERTSLLLEGGPDQVNVTLLMGDHVELARALVTPSADAWAAAELDDALLESLLGPLLRDLKISMRTRVAAKAPHRVLVAGAMAQIPGVLERLTVELRATARPLALDAEVKLPREQLNDASAALALALALHAQQPRGHLNFRSGEFAFTKDASKVRGRMVGLAASAAMLLALWLGLGLTRLASLSTDAQAYDDALCTATKKILGECLTDYRQAVSRMSGGASKAAGIPRVSGAEVLAEVISHLPDGALPLLDNLDVTTTSVRIKGVCENFTQVDQIIASLKTDKCFGEIKSPRMDKQRDSTKVQFGLDFAYTCSGESGGS